MNLFNKNSWHKKYLTVYLVIFLLLIGFLSGFVVGGQNIAEWGGANAEVAGQVVNVEENNIPDYLKKDVDFNLFWDVWQTVEEDYIDKDVPPAQMFYGSLAGIVASLKDPHSVFFDPETTKKFTEELSGSFEGIGAEIGIKNNRLTIIAPLPDTPAEQAGLRAGDKVFAIDNLDTTNISLDYAVSLIRGEKGTDVTLTISRDGLEELQDIIITRGTIDIVTVKWENKTVNNKKIAYIKISHFNSDTDVLFDQAVDWVLRENPDGIILDLRNNPGGFLNTAIKVASEWIEREVVVIEKFSENRDKKYHSRWRPRLAVYPTVVLTNRGSASGSEIVAGALQDYGLATLVGEQTFGKGSVQELKELKDGSAIKLTVAKWLTPKGREIDKEGISPDVEVELTHDDYNNDRDPQLDKALEILGK